MAKGALHNCALALLIGVFFACAPAAPDWPAADGSTAGHAILVRSSNIHSSCNPLVDYLKAKAGFSGRLALATLVTAAAPDMVCGLDLNGAADRLASSAALSRVHIPRAPPSVL